MRDADMMRKMVKSEGREEDVTSGMEMNAGRECEERMED